MDDDAWLRPDPSPWPARVLALVVALLVTGPALAPGYVLLRDMVFVPRQDLDLDALGLGGTAPRAVPVDAAMGLLTAVVPGELVQKAVLLGLVYAAVLGAARLVPGGPDGRRGIGGPVAGLVYGWSPYLAERLLMGHWTFLLAWASLPWIARAVLRLEARVPGALPRLVLVCVPAALSSTGAVLAAGVVLALARGRRAVLSLAALGALGLPWVVAGLLHPAGGGSDPDGVSAFAARAENWAGTAVAVLGTGGVWNGGAVPASRTTLLAPVVTLLLLALAAAGWWRSGALRGPGRRLLLLGLAGLVLALAGAVPVLGDALAAVVDAVPGAGLLRDGQKWVAWWALPLAVGAGLGARRLAALDGGRLPSLAATAVALCLPLVAVPDLAWGVGGRLQPVAYPEEWTEVREALAGAPDRGHVLALPFGAYRAFDWNDGRPLLDPAPRWLPVPTVVDDELVVGGRNVAGEDPRARALATVDDPARLAELGVGWVLVEHGTPGRTVPPAVADLPVAFDGEQLDLHRVPGPIAEVAPSPRRVTAVHLAHACALGTVVTSVLWIIIGPSTVTLRRRPSRKRVLA